MKQTLKITKILEQRSGVSKAGNNWVVQEFVTEETEGNYPKTIAMQVFGADNVNDFTANYAVGDIVDIDFDIESREYNGRYYTQVSAWRIEKHTDGTEAEQTTYADTSAQPTAATQQTTNSFTPADDESDLPF